MKAILSLIVSGALVVSGYAQTRNVLVGTNNTVVQPTNFWSADASNARTGLGLGTAATNPASAFQPSSATLSNLASSNAVNLTNLRATNLVGLIPTSNIPSTTLTNISGTLAVTQGGTGATNIGNARTNLGATSIGDAVFTATNAAAARTAIGALATNGDATNLTNFPANLLRTNGNGSGLANLTAANITGTVGLASNVTGTVAISNGGTGATNAGGARTNLGLGSVSSNSFNVTGSAIYTLTNFVVTNGVAFFGGGGGSYFATFESTNTGFAGFIGGVGYFHNGSNVWYVNTNGLEFSAPSVVRSNLGLSFAALTNTNASNFRTAIGATTIGHSLFTATNSAAAINAIGLSTNFSDQVLSVSNIFIGSFPSSAGFVVPTSGKTLTVAGTNVSTGIPAFFGWNGFSGVAFSAAEARTNLGLNAWTTNTNSPVFVNTNGEVVSPTNFWQRAPIQTTVQDFTGITVNQTNNATNARNVYVYSLATNVSGISNTIILPTNVSTFNGDDVTVVHKGTTNTTTVVRQAGSTNNLITLNKFDESVKFIRELGQWDFYHNISFVEPIQFSGTNAAANAAASRTNLGLGTTNDVEFRTVKINLSTGAGDSLIVTNSSSSALSTFDDIFVDELDAISAAFGNTVIVSSSGISFNTNTAAAATRTNLGLPLAALTNTSVTNFQKAIFYTNTAPSNIGGNLGTIAAWIEIVASNGVTYKVPAYTNVP